MPNEQWEYRHVDLGDPEALTRTLNAHGRDGWEAVGYAIYGSVHHCVLLKRRLAGEDGARRAAAERSDDSTTH